jgi:hypothetical protein
MGKSHDWNQWYSEFAATWRPQVRAFIASHPKYDLRSGMLWRWERRATPVPQEALNRFCQPTQEDLSWFVAALQDERRWFVARLVELGGSMSETLFEPMVTSAAGAEEPSLNRWLIRPCVQFFGVERVREYLVTLAESADASTVLGAIDAMYWTETEQGNEATYNLFERRKLFLLEECIAGRVSSYARHKILLLVTSNSRRFPESHRELVVRAQALWDEHMKRVETTGVAGEPSR